MLLHPGSFARVLGCLVMTNNAPDPGPNQAVMTNKMAGDPADRRTLQTSRGIGRGSGQARNQQRYRTINARFMQISPRPEIVVF